MHNLNHVPTHASTCPYLPEALNLVHLDAKTFSDPGAFLARLPGAQRLRGKDQDVLRGPQNRALASLELKVHVQDL